LPEERALKMVARGSTFRAAAREHGISEERLRRHARENVVVSRTGRAWYILDRRPRQFPIYSDGRVASPWLAPEEATRASDYMRAVNEFIRRESARAKLKAFDGAGVRDIYGKFYPFETDPNALLELKHADELSFPEIYKIVS
jgi:hypothetical protein